MPRQHHLRNCTVWTRRLVGSHCRNWQLETIERSQSSVAASYGAIGDVASSPSNGESREFAQPAFIAQKLIVPPLPHHCTYRWRLWR
jgi:hypothetical protein